MEKLLEHIISELKELKERQTQIEKKLDSVVEQTSELAEFRAETKQSLEVLKDNL